MSSHFRVYGRFTPGGSVGEATVTVDRGAGLFSVRRLHCRTVSTLPLATVAEMVAWRVARVNALEAQRERTARRRR